VTPIPIRICIDVDDVDRAVDFYGRALGLTVRRRFDSGFAEMAGATVPVDLLGKPGGTTPYSGAGAGETRRYGRHWTPIHLDVVVDDIDVAVARAVEAGARLERAVQQQPWGRLAVLADPFGHGFCFIQLIGRGYDEAGGPAAGGSGGGSAGGGSATAR